MSTPLRRSHALTPKVARSHFESSHDAPRCTPDRFYRGHVTSDGRAYNNRAELIGVINVTDGTAGSHDYHYLGCVQTVFRAAARPDRLQDSFLGNTCPMRGG